MKTLPKKSSDWLKSEALQKVFDALESHGGEVRVNGGAVRNSIMEMPVSDVDLSTTLVPDEIIKALKAAGIKSVPTGIDHGTVMAVSNGIGYEVTTLREDIETFGRKAKVRFGTDWQCDAARRDLTMNALYCDRDGRLYDPLGGLEDAKNCNVRFIGEADERITEDYLRILRFFRFFAWYGKGRPDAKGLKACARLKDGLEQISAERIWAELKKMLLAPDPGRAFLWMRTSGVLNIVLPESQKWGIDLLAPLLQLEQKQRWEPDSLLRIETMMRPEAANVIGFCKRLKLSARESKRLMAWAGTQIGELPKDEAALDQLLYRDGSSGICDALKLRLAGLDETDDEQAKKLAAFIPHCQKWKRPVFPVKGEDLIKVGMKSSVEIGNALKRLEVLWIKSDFALKKDALLKKLPDFSEKKN